MTRLKNYNLRILPISIFLIVSFSCNFCAISCEFLYPVAVTEQDGKTKVYVLHQKSISNIELWVWDPETKFCTKGLLSSYIPASLKILPSGDGFSFIDAGRIRIKKFDKRSPKSIDIYEPVYDISQLHWIDEQNFYLSAKKNNKFCIFHVHESGLIKTVLQDSGQDSQNLDSQGQNAQNLDLQDVVCDFQNRDFMYPQKMGDSLFFIERVMAQGEYKKEHVSYKIFKTAYPELCNQARQLMDLVENSDDFDYKTKKIQEFTDEFASQDLVKKNCRCLVDFKGSPIAFLSMITENEGFFLKHPESICKHDEIVTFECFSLKQGGDIWETKKIFSFSIPANLILEVPDTCLYESILPLLPKYYNNKIYFVNFDTKDQNLNIFSYNLLDNQIEQKTCLKTSQILFPPVFYGNIAFCGGKIDYANGGSGIDSVKMWLDHKEGSVCMDFVKISV
jgi:hypothetical protein